MSRRELMVGLSLCALFSFLLVGGCATTPKPSPKKPDELGQTKQGVRFEDGVQPGPQQLHVCGTYEGAFVCISWEHFQQVRQEREKEKAQKDYEL